jgi:hypothetical protein
MVVVNPMRLSAAIGRNAAVAVVAATGGFVGGAVHDWGKTAPDEIRAKRFEVVTTSGRVLSFWGPDADPQIPAATPKGVLMVFLDPNGVRRCQIGSSIGDYGPEILFYDANGPSETKRREYSEPRFGVRLGYNEDAVLGMRNRTSWRVLLGAEHGDAPDPSEDTWGLRIRGGGTSEAGVFGYRTYFGQYTAGVFVRDKGDSWSVPPDLGSRLSLPSQLHGR